MEQALLELSRAVDGNAAVGHLALLVHHRAAASRASLGHGKGRCALGALAQHRPHHLGNDVAGLVNRDGIPHAHVLAVDFIDVVQRGARNGGAGHRHRIELRHGGEHAGAPHLDADLAQEGLLLLRWELEGNGPARCASGEAQIVLQGEGVHLHHHAVDVVV